MLDATADTEDEILHIRRRMILESLALHKRHMDELTRLEQAAWMERAALGNAEEIYLPSELEEATAIRAQMASLIEQAAELNRTITCRLRRESMDDTAKATLLARFERMEGVRLVVPAF